MTRRWGVRTSQGSRIGISWEGIDVTGDTGRLINPQVHYENALGEEGLEKAGVDNSPVKLRPDAPTNQRYAVSTQHGHVMVDVTYPAAPVWEQPEFQDRLTDELLAAIRERDALVIPRFLTPRMSYAEHQQLQAEMDRRALLAEVDRLRNLEREVEPPTQLEPDLEALRLGLEKGLIIGPYGTRKRLVDLLDEVTALRRWKAEMLKVLSGLQELGDALDLKLGDGITGAKAAEAVNKLKAENAELQELALEAITKLKAENAQLRERLEQAWVAGDEAAMERIRDYERARADRLKGQDDG